MDPVSVMDLPAELWWLVVDFLGEAHGLDRTNRVLCGILEDNQRWLVIGALGNRDLSALAGTTRQSLRQCSVRWAGRPVTPTHVLQLAHACRGGRRLCRGVGDRRHARRRSRDCVALECFVLDIAFTELSSWPLPPCCRSRPTKPGLLPMRSTGGAAVSVLLRGVLSTCHLCLRTLDLGLAFTSFTDRDAAAVGRILARCPLPALRFLRIDLSGNPLGVAGVLALMPAEWVAAGWCGRAARLASLDLAMDSLLLGDDGVVAVVRRLTLAPALPARLALSLRCAGLQATGAAALGDLLQANASTLRHVRLYLRNNRLTTSGALAGLLHPEKGAGGWAAQCDRLTLPQLLLF